MRKSIFLLLHIPLLVGAQETKKPDVWTPLRFFLGTWKGEKASRESPRSKDNINPSLVANTYKSITNQCMRLKQTTPKVRRIKTSDSSAMIAGKDSLFCDSFISKVLLINSRGKRSPRVAS